jgi:ABC-type branched-subunit amino acid transport system ATPase component
MGLLTFADGFQGLVTSVMTPEIGRSLGISASGMVAVSVLKNLALAASAAVFAAIAGRWAIRGALSIITGFGWSVATLFTGFVRTPAQYAAVNVFDGATSGTTATVQVPLLLDTYPPDMRNRVTAIRSGFLQVAGLVAPLSVTGLIVFFDLTWRGVSVVLAGLSLLACLFALGLRDPGFGKWDTEKVRESVHGLEGGQVTLSDSVDPSLGFFEATRRLWLIPSVRKVLLATIVGSVGATPAATYFTYFLADRWGLDAAARGVFSTLVGVVAVALLPLAAKLGDRLYSLDPARVIRVIVIADLVAVGLSVVALLSPVYAVLVVAYGFATGIPNAFGPALSTTLMNTIPAKLRSHFIALVLILGTAVGGLLGALLLSGLNDRFGVTGSLLILTVPGVISVLLLNSVRGDINRDLDAGIKQVVEAEDLATLRASGHRPPLLSCKGIDFSYGPVQVLFDVDFTVDEGEMVALLGTNGAGKSTLLGVVSGLNLPSAGTVRLDGGDITYIDAERRVPMGVSQVIGGRAVFGPLSVAENLRLYGYSLGRQKREIDKRIDEAFAAFPRLAERRNQQASTLSGGEQQMLGLSQALILRPRLLCIDELSLGLAPKVVGELLTMVRRINDRGTAVILVEQSATVALSLVHHAYFMERGQMKFDGAAADLAGRDDLLRSVFLQGVGQTIGAGRGAR